MSVTVPQQPRFDLDSFNRTNAAPTAAATPLPARSTTVNVQPMRFNGLVWFIIFALLIGVIFFFMKPAFVQSVDPATGELRLDWGKLILWTVVIALIILVLMWLTRGIHGLIVG